MLGDDFESDSLAEWEVFQGEDASFVIEGGQLHIEPSDRSLWFNATTAFHLFRTVESDGFMVTAPVRVRRISMPDLPPETQYRLGGIMVRDPSAGAPNYVFIVMGADDNDVSVETKTTINGSSSYEGPPWPSGEGELRICRLGSTFHLLIRELGGAWSLQATFDRPDLPSRVAVGPVAYANNAPADVRISYEEIVFAAVAGEGDCMQ